MVKIFCPDINNGCTYQSCMYYLSEADACLRVLKTKDDLNILSNAEKQALNNVRKQNLQCGGTHEQT